VSDYSIRSRYLPPYQAIFAVDVKDFSAFESVAQAGITARIRPIVAAAFRRCGLGEIWDEERWHRVIGDAYVAGFPTRALPLLIHPLLDALQVQLEEENRVSRDERPSRPLRMRASIHVGPITDADDDPVTDGSGAARVETHRLLDSAEVKQVLSRAGDGTLVAAIVSDRAFTDAVLGGFCALGPDRFTSVEVAVKQYRGSAWLAVPVASGDLLARGIRPLTEEGDAEAGDASAHQGAQVIGIGSIAGDATNVFVGNSGSISTVDDPDRLRRPRRRR
jgi:hypothetical protein